ncbi:flagellar export chaperone FliS [Actinophytocola xanthii]|uniref:Flagellar export chaperone FliS n=1 Tax=Actinophytocola xanthii TaxID=1912961 RepID=A0A1Q8CYC3_9PSEU|nr:flagellar export chaperone FliS [Actinophytocola xanthii]OLF19364.1 flagellar export chaperone FliS [Actinophytocola xanthii]
MSPAAFHQRYLTDSISTASPGRLLVMLYDRLCLDLERAAAAATDGRRDAASAALLHAQDILLELRGSLRTDDWPAGQQLADIYSFLLAELMDANLRQDVEKITASLAVAEPLRDTWRQVVEAQAPAAGIGAPA